MDDPRTESRVLVVAARDGDRAAMARLYRRFAPSIQAMLLRRLRPADVDDLVHDIFLEAMRRLDSLQDVGAFETWLRTITRRRAIDQTRRNTRRPSPLATEPVDPRAARTGLTAERVLEAIATLPRPYQQCLSLRLIEGLTGPEIARRTGRSHDAVRVNLHRGMHQLRRLLAEEES